jgi:WhiB family redox-sensing transcriptional regulator
VKLPGAWHPDPATLLLAADEDLSWQDAARCAEIDPDLMFPPKGGNVAYAKRVCASCEVSAQCLEYALANTERFGIWGGTTERQRRVILAGRQPGVPRCESGWHPLTGANLGEDGKCRACAGVRSVRDRQTRRETRELAA